MTLVQKFKKRFYFVAAGYFRFFARRALRRWRPRIIAITGSVGKTTMLHLVEGTLGSKAHYSHDANSAFGVAFDLVGLKGIYGSKLRWFYLIFAVPIRSIFYKHTEEFYVVEIDGERPHEAEFLATWLKPEVTLWISLGRSHAVQFDQQVKNGIFKDIDSAIAHEFATIPANTTKRVYIDGDIPLMVENTAGISAEIIPVYLEKLKKYSIYPDHTEFTIDDHTFYFAQPQPRALAIQLMILTDLAKYLKIPLETDFSDLPVPPGRCSYFEGKNGLKLIDSSYNAHLISVTSILEMTSDMSVKHKWLVLGDMVEQGSIESEEHTKLADVIAKVHPEQVILIGRRTKEYTAPILKEKGIATYTTNDPREALQFIEKHTTGKETLVFKGSQYLEWIIEKLLKNPDDAKKLPRREAAAVKRRAKRGLN